MSAYTEYGYRRRAFAALALCMAYALLLLLFLSTDSYLADTYMHGDSAWFFTCGKAWMSGMTPYVDFTDSKGPLLWLIFGAGYLLSHHSFAGVFWISAVLFAAAFAIAYKTARLYLPRPAAALAVAVTAFFIFFKRYNYEILAESYCLPAIFACLYVVCRILAFHERPRARWSFLAMAVTGAAVGCCALIKWNVALMTLSLAAIALWLSVRRGRAVPAAAGLVAGFAAVTLPMALYFVAKGNFTDFINEYFFLTSSLTLRRGGLSLGRLAHSFLTEWPIFLLMLAGAVIFGWRHKTGMWMAAALCFFKLCCGYGYIPYRYIVALTPFALFLSIAAAGAAARVLSERRLVVPICLVAVTAATILVNRSIKVNGQVSETPELREDFYNAAYVMSQVECPRFVSLTGDLPVGVPVGALPACKYYAQQTRATDDMRNSTLQAIRSGVPDFIYTYNHSHVDFPADSLESHGYVFYCYIEYRWCDDTLKLYGRPGLRLPPDGFKVTDWDIWLKRNIFNI